MTEASLPQDQLDHKLTQVFDGKVVRKDLVRKVKVGANVPVFVLEYLLGKYCASSDEMAIQMGLQVVNDNQVVRLFGAALGHFAAQHLGRHADAIEKPRRLFSGGHLLE